MIDSDIIKALIVKRSSFTIGSKGICIKCIPSMITYRWTIQIPRASVYLEVSDISILDDENFYNLTFDIDGSGVYYSLTDLTAYDKLTPGV